VVRRETFDALLVASPIGFRGGSQGLALGEVTVMDTKTKYPDAVSTFPGTQHDFIRAMKSLGAIVEPDGLGCQSHDPLHCAMRCSSANWVRVFGPVRILAVQFGPGGHPAFEAWEYQCADGSVLCVGCQCERGSQEDWVMVRALYLS
jgi:hypothetical protein